MLQTWEWLKSVRFKPINNSTKDYHRHQIQQDWTADNWTPIENLENEYYIARIIFMKFKKKYLKHLAKSINLLNPHDEEHFLRIIA